MQQNTPKERSTKLPFDTRSSWPHRRMQMQSRGMDHTVESNLKEKATPEGRISLRHFSKNAYLHILHMLINY